MEAKISPPVSLNKLMCYSIGIIYIWFGALKLFPGLSPAENLAGQTLHLLSFKMISPEIGVRSLAIGELVIGIGFFIGKWNKVVLTAFLLHMFGTFTPLFLLTDVSFNTMPYALTLVGQYIIKNLLFVAVGIWMWRECK